MKLVSINAKTVEELHQKAKRCEDLRTASKMEAAVEKLMPVIIELTNKKWSQAKIAQWMNRNGVKWFTRSNVCVALRKYRLDHPEWISPWELRATPDATLDPQPEHGV